MKVKLFAYACNTALLYRRSWTEAGLATVGPVLEQTEDVTIAMAHADGVLGTSGRFSFQPCRRRGSCSTPRRESWSTISRAHDASVSANVECNRLRRDRRYWLKNEKVIDMLGITPSEEKEMRTFISKDTK